MNYDLCKRLKDAGFPQTGERIVTTDRAACTDDYYRCIAPIEENCYCARCEDLEGWCAVPTLSELIAACGEKFLELNAVFREMCIWKAYSFPDEEGESLEGEGATPEEAVANLWLNLNESR